MPKCSGYAASGSDSNPGINPARPWKTLGKVNCTTFAPGDRIGFAAGRRWNGKLHIFIETDDVKDTRFDDILIEACRIQSIDNTGIFIRSRAKGSNTPGRSYNLFGENRGNDLFS